MSKFILTYSFEILKLFSKWLTKINEYIKRFVKNHMYLVQIFVKLKQIAPKTNNGLSEDTDGCVSNPSKQFQCHNGVRSESLPQHHSCVYISLLLVFQCQPDLFKKKKKKKKKKRWFGQGVCTGTTANISLGVLLYQRTLSVSGHLPSC